MVYVTLSLWHRIHSLHVCENVLRLQQIDLCVLLFQHVTKPTADHRGTQYSTRSYTPYTASDYSHTTDLDRQKSYGSDTYMSESDQSRHTADSSVRARGDVKRAPAKDTHRFVSLRRCVFICLSQQTTSRAHFTYELPGRHHGIKQV